MPPWRTGPVEIVPVCAQLMIPAPGRTRPSQLEIVVVSFPINTPQLHQKLPRAVTEPFPLAIPYANGLSY
jgi:hypothetical protein